MGYRTQLKSSTSVKPLTWKKQLRKTHSRYSPSFYGASFKIWETALPGPQVVEAGLASPYCITDTGKYYCTPKVEAPALLQLWWESYDIVSRVSNSELKRLSPNLGLIWFDTEKDVLIVSDVLCDTLETGHILSHTGLSVRLET